MEPFDLLIGTEASPPVTKPATDAFERYMLRALVLSHINSFRKGEYYVITADFMRWYSIHAKELSLKIPQLDNRRKKYLDVGDCPPVLSVKLSHRALRANRIAAPASSALQKRLDWVASMLSLDTRNALILGTIFRLSHSAAYRPFAMLLGGGYKFMDDDDIELLLSAPDGHGATDEVDAGTVASLLGISKREMDAYFGDNAPLRQFGLLEDRDGGDFAPSELLVSLLRMETEDPQLLERSLFGKLRAPQLTRSDFAHLGGAVDDIVCMIAGAFAKGEKGISLLFHGEPGTGKTEFATLLASLCNAHVVFAGETDADEKEPSRGDRLTHLSLLSAIGQRVGRTIVVVDEAEDIFVGVDTGRGSDRRGSKVFLNRLVETVPVPTIWITNHPDRLGEAVLRRMVRAVEFRKPGIAVRRRIIDRHATTFDLALDITSRNRLAQVPVAPAVIASALRAARLASAHGDAGADRVGDMALASALSIHKVMTGSEPDLPADRGSTFDASLSSADVDLMALEERVAAVGPGALSFLFTGLPGTGKSAFARHLAERLGMEVLEKRGSDLLGIYVGQTEANIAEAFQEARDNEMFLIFDEADSLLADRRSAVRNWEVSQVNEMLTWMERHPLPFAATSNLPENLDPAVQRRFLFKARFDAMSKAQIARAFSRYFGCDAPATVLKLELLTPGDFVVVARKARVLQETDARVLGEMLKAEVALKPGAREPIGFV